MASFPLSAFRALKHYGRVTVWTNLLFIASAWPGTLWAGDHLAELREKKDLTPETFLRQFADFQFELGDTVQEPERFLERRRGDCDDFSQLAATILTERGYTTKIIVVMMERETHVVCYVAEAGGFLDFNRRAQEKPIMESDGTLEDIAGKIANDFRCKWRMVSEVRYEKTGLFFVENVFYHAPSPSVATQIQSPPSASSLSPVALLAQKREDSATP